MTERQHEELAPGTRVSDRDYPWVTGEVIQSLETEPDTYLVKTDPGLRVSANPWVATFDELVVEPTLPDRQRGR